MSGVGRVRRIRGEGGVTRNSVSTGPGVPLWRQAIPPIRGLADVLMRAGLAVYSLTHAHPEPADDSCRAGCCRT